MAFHIFIIDDDPIDQFVTQKVISSLYTGSQIETFSQASSALAKLQCMAQEDTAHFPHLIILDINMPIMNGFDFLEGFAQLPTFLLSKCRVIMLSSSLHYQDISIAMTYKEVRTYISKPLTTQILACAMEESFP